VEKVASSSQWMLWISSDLSTGPSKSSSIQAFLLASTASFLFAFHRVVLAYPHRVVPAKAGIHAEVAKKQGAGFVGVNFF
jgi:hypothetical protein